jgi:hypothetical protein
MITLTKDMIKDFDFMYNYCSTDCDNVYKDCIFWNKKILFATNGKVFIWTETVEENPEGFSVWRKEKKNYILDAEKAESFHFSKPDEKIFKYYTQFNYDFTLKYDKENVLLCSGLASSKKNRHLDIISFDFDQDNVHVVFNKEDENDETELNMGDMLKDFSDSYSKDFIFKLPLWCVLLLAKQTKDDIKCKIQFDEIYSSYIKMTSGKWNLIAMISMY